MLLIAKFSPSISTAVASLKPASNNVLLPISKRLILLDYESNDNNYEEALRTGMNMDYLKKKYPIVKSVVPYFLLYKK